MSQRESRDAAASDVVIGLGSNLGERLAHLQRAVHCIDALPGCRVLCCSPVYATRPVGPAQPDFLNAAVRIRASCDLPALLKHVHGIERSLGRHRDRETVRWGPRIIDLDILWAEATIETPDLTVPHPELERRRFALQPLLDVAPHLQTTYGSVCAALDPHGLRLEWGPEALQKMIRDVDS